MRWVLLTIILKVLECNCGRILAIIQTPSYSHQLAFRPIWDNLVSRGHDITLMTTDPYQSKYGNFTQIDWSSAYKPYNNVFSKVVHEKNFFKGFYMGANMVHQIVDEELSHPEVQNILKGDSKFDLVMIEYSYPAMFAFKKRFNCTFIGLSSFDVPMQGHEAVGDPTNPVLYPDYLMPFLRPRNLFERAYSTAYQLFIKSYNLLLLDHIHQQNVVKHFGSDYPSISELMNSVDILFLNVNPIFQNIRPVMPNVIYFGGSRQLNPRNSLDKDLEQFINGADRGVIYFNLGTNVKSEFLPQELKTVLLKVFAKLSYSVLWKYEGDDIGHNIPDNVRLQKWYPQQDLLRHTNIKLFITQGGIQSIEEAVLCNVPMIAIPFFGDQFSNAQKMHEMGYGYYIDSKTITEQYLTEVILEVIENKEYRTRIKEMSDLLLDVPMPGIDKVVWWTEYALRHKDLKHLQSAAVPMYQFYLLDVLAFLATVTCCLVFALHWTVKLLLSKVEKRKIFAVLISIYMSYMLVTNNKKPK